METYIYTYILFLLHNVHMYMCIHTCVHTHPFTRSPYLNWHARMTVGEFSEWGLSSLIELVSRYVPASEEETYAIMNLLDPMLRTANSGSVLSTLKCFIHLTEKMTVCNFHVLNRLLLIYICKLHWNRRSYTLSCMPAQNHQC
jgi:vesicle coat complex subunit